MGELKLKRLNKILREFNISLDRAVEFLASNGHDIDARPTTKISPDQYTLFLNEFSSDKSSKVESHDLSEEKRKEKDGTEIIGNIIHCKNYKSRLTKENKVVDVRLTYDKGLDRYYGLLDLALKYNLSLIHI